MPVFTYQAKKGPQDFVSDVIEAESREEAVNKLIQDGMVPIRVELSGEVKDRSIAVSAWFGKVKPRDLNTMTRQLASLIKAGIPLLKALHIITEQTENEYLKGIVADISQQVKQGQTFSGAMAKYPKIFPPLYTAIIKSGEDSGALDEVLSRLADYREQVEEIKSRIRSALAYPALIIAFGFGALIFLFTVVIPQLSKVFETLKLKGALPLPTAILLGIGDAVINYWYLFIGGLFLLILLSKGITLIEKKALDKLKFGLPFIGVFIRKSESAKLARTLSLLITNGIPILDALEMTIPTLGAEPMKESLKNITDGLRNGQTFAQGLKGSPYFFPFMNNMVTVGEESGRLDEVLKEVAGFYEREVNEAIKIGLSLLEPILIIVVALGVGFVVISLLLPIFQLSEIVQ
ncbi:MAG: type II secretion system F family protein [Planctomycetes bacterium]|nr:type II secretion system F family protein [Planctomycetota bacterium]